MAVKKQKKISEYKNPMMAWQDYKFVNACYDSSKFVQKVEDMF